MAVRAIREAIQIDGNERDLILEGASELVREMLRRNHLTNDDLISIVFTATPDLDAEFPACHLTRQDWGVPVRVAAGGTTRLPLVLRGLDA